MTSDPFVQAERLVQNALGHLPSFISRFFGYRGKKLTPAPWYVVSLWGFIGAFGGLGTLFAVFGYTDYFTSRDVPPIVASYGASAILCYGAIEVPLAQPRALIFGHFFSALVGIIVAIIFDLDLTDEWDDLEWVAACLATAIALVVMHLTKTTHPPAGATALLPCTNARIWALKWYFLPVVLLSSSLVLASALIVNNVQRQYPKFWITPIPPPPEPPVSKQHRHRTPLALENQPKEKLHKQRDLRDLESG
ncbi:hypothetical protein P154DRAFT_615253 [Amniculicola lignicola CBS 123094]|uniref:HPP transmembrane region domain-containing protein n=1 Tax=Amniculicola lignicola CBS 123094 TaxID=1392246 RepID=A0A6A5WZ99_9PLEO|nr:hypothetical protein P154DRAFT_615253 [Amniculicola lignicola CBS 123094]